MKRDFDIVDRCIELTIDVINIAKKLKQANHYVIADQVIRSTGGIGANVSEAQASRSKMEFESTNNIVLKEAKRQFIGSAVIEKISTLVLLIPGGFSRSKRRVARLNIIAAIILSSKNRRKNATAKTFTFRLHFCFLIFAFCLWTYLDIAN